MDRGECTTGHEKEETVTFRTRPRAATSTMQADGLGLRNRLARRRGSEAVVLHQMQIGNIVMRIAFRERGQTRRCRQTADSEPLDSATTPPNMHCLPHVIPVSGNPPRLPLAAAARHTLAALCRSPSYISGQFIRAALLHPSSAGNRTGPYHLRHSSSTSQPPGYLRCDRFAGCCGVYINTRIS